MIELLRDNPLLLLFVVVAVGYPLGRLRIAGSTIGVASVLFAGLAIGALDSDLQLPEIVYQLGLVLFVYTIGLSSGPRFFSSLRRKGLQYNLLVSGALLGAAGVVIVVRAILDLNATLAVGMFAGSLTNTPALASVLDSLSTGQTSVEPVVAYSVTYPMGVIGVIVAIALLRRRWKIDYAREERASEGLNTGTRHLQNRTFRVTNPAVDGETIAALIETYQWNVVFGRLQRGDLRTLAVADTRLRAGDLISVIGQENDLEAVASVLGEATDEHLEFDRTRFDFRRIFVSNPEVAGHRLRDLDLPQHQGTLITRIRRGDVEFVPHGDTVLELGDRVRVVMARRDMDAVSDFLGDSYRALSEIDVLTFSLGIGMGLLLGAVPIPIPGGPTISLGMAGGPLVVALILGALVRTGPFVWGLPYNANLTLRQMGLILFLAGVGTRSGRAFIETVADREGIVLFLGGAIVTLLVAVGTLWVGYRLLKIPMGLLIGILAGLQTQPAVLGFATDETGDDLPSVGYAAVYPVATISKILLAQLLLATLS